ncbi:MAG: SBBP repeat-containing protein [Ignavibacteria bacterium]|nr:SBBP repeat-containing protein [Ignavibacteria bacterium]
MPLIKYLILVNISLFTFSLYSQVNPEWLKLYNGANNLNDRGYRSVLDDSGHIYLGGTTEISLNKVNALLIKYNSNGEIVWKRQFDTTSNSSISLYGMDIDNFGNIYITGIIYTSNYNVIIAKYNAAGTLLWHRLFNPGGIEDWPSQIALDDSGNAYIVGYGADLNLKYDMFTLKYNGNGDLKWHKKYNGPANRDDFGLSIDIDKIGNIVVTGYSEDVNLWDAIIIKYTPEGDVLWNKRFGTLGNGESGFVVKTDEEFNVYVAGEKGNGSMNRDIMTLKYNGGGVLLWQSYYAGPAFSFDQASDLVYDNSGNIYVTGISVQSATNYTTIKYNSSGQQQWISIYAGPYGGSDAANSIAVDTYGNVYVTGESNNLNQNFDIATVKYNSAGLQQWVYRFNGSGDEEDGAYVVKTDHYNNVYVTGYTKSLDNYDAVIMKFSSITPVSQGSTEIPKHIKLYQNYPNPFNPSTRIRFDLPSSGLASMIILDISGRELEKFLYNVEEKGLFEVEINMNKYSSGIYFYMLEINGFADTKKMILLK